MVASCGDKADPVTEPEPEAEPEVVVEQDLDGDGYTVDDGDCDDADANVSPDAVETCNGIDDDCDGDVDEGLLVTFYADSDGDEYGDADDAQEACEQPNGYVEDDSDCDDTDGMAHPGAEEICDNIDNDCDMEVDEDEVCDSADGCVYYIDEKPADPLDADVALCPMSVDADTIDVHMSNPELELAGFQFGFQGVDVVGFDESSGSSVTAGFMMSFGQGTILGFSLTGAAIPPGDGLLIRVDVSSAADPCIVGAVIAGPGGTELLGAEGCAQ